MPGTNAFTTTSYAGNTMLAAPGVATTTSTSDFQYINQKTKTPFASTGFYDAPTQVDPSA